MGYTTASSRQAGCAAWRSAWAAAVVLLIGVPPVVATDIEGVQPAALDQPRVNVMLRRDSRQLPLAGKAGTDLLDLMEAKPKAKKTYNISAFLDTGASGVVISAKTADAMGVLRATVRSATTGQMQRVLFHDVGVGGTDRFEVSEPLYVAMAAYAPGTDTEDPGRDYRMLPWAMRAQVGPLGGGAGLLEALVGSLDVMGMPTMAGKVVVIDPKPVNGFDDTMRTYVYEARTPYNAAQAKRNPGIPPVNRHVKLSYASFARFTQTVPASGPGPTLGRNPFIGPDPLAKAGARADGTPPVTIVHGGKSSVGSWLLDTGAAVSMISTKQAAAVGITYGQAGGLLSDPVLKGVAKEKQFTLTVGGIGGGKKSAGFYVDELRVQTMERDVLVYKQAPVLVCDITVSDPNTGEKYTLEGVFGMNFLVASAKLTEGLLPDIGKLTEGPFDWVVFDEPNGVLGVQLRRP